jgi:hypothetical protein
VDASAAELEQRVGVRRVGVAAELAGARDRLEQARAHLATTPEQPYAWIAHFSPALAGAALRDVPEARLRAVRPALVRLAAAGAEPEPLLALGAGGTGVVAVTPRRVLTATDAGVTAQAPAEAGGAIGALEELQPGRLVAVLELLRHVELLQRR